MIRPSSETRRHPVPAPVAAALGDFHDRFRWDDRKAPYPVEALRRAELQTGS